MLVPTSVQLVSHQTCGRPNLESNLAVTCHFIDGEDKVGTILLEEEHFPGTHTAENLALGHTRFMEEWGVKDKTKCLVTDAAADRLACVNTLHLRHDVSITYCLHLLVKKLFDEVAGQLRCSEKVPLQKKH